MRALRARICKCSTYSVNIVIAPLLDCDLRPATPSVCARAPCLPARLGLRVVGLDGPAGVVTTLERVAAHTRTRTRTRREAEHHQVPCAPPCPAILADPRPRTYAPPKPDPAREARLRTRNYALIYESPTPGLRARASHLHARTLGVTREEEEEDRRLDHAQSPSGTLLGFESRFWWWRRRRARGAVRHSVLGQQVPWDEWDAFLLRVWRCEPRHQKSRRAEGRKGGRAEGTGAPGLAQMVVPSGPVSTSTLRRRGTEALEPGVWIGSLEVER